jgi:YD repeat-containing protein
VAYRYDPATNHLTGFVDPENALSTFTYAGPGGNLSLISDPRGNDTSITYDPQDRVASVIHHAADHSDPTTSFPWELDLVDCPNAQQACAPARLLSTEPRSARGYTTYY